MKQILKMRFGPGKRNNGKDRVIKADTPVAAKRGIKVLIFADSRAASLNTAKKNWWADRFFRYLKKKGVQPLLVTRPKDCTTFLTLMNFLRMNTVAFDYMVSQVGFVDFTPKKASVVRDIMDQKEVFFRSMKFRKKKLGRYRLLNRKTENLYSIDFNTAVFKKSIARDIKKRFKKAFFLGTLELKSDIKLKRKRPYEFFDKLKETNAFLRSLSRMTEKIEYLEPDCGRLSEREAFTYDGVHYTKKGHDKIYKAVIKNMKKELVAKR